MNRKDLIGMARKVGLTDGVELRGEVEAIERFAALIAAAEREECAKLCGELADDAAKCQDFHAISALEEAMSVIRARGENG